MNKKIIYSLKSPYRDDFEITGYSFGSGEKSVCIVGALRGNEIQQLYICSQLIKELERLEKKGEIHANNEILVIPSVNHYSMNISKRFWALDNTDINRMFPGDSKGETTQRIAAGLFEEIKGYCYGIQFTSFYMPGDFIPHIRIMSTGYENSNLAHLFGLKYVALRNPKPYDTTTLNYNWQLWDTCAFSFYTNATEEIDEKSANQAVVAVLRFLSRMGIIKFKSHNGYISTLIKEDELAVIKVDTPGIYRRLKNLGDRVECGEVVAEVIHPYEGKVISKIKSHTEGIVFFAYKSSTVMENTVVFKIIKRLYE